jgi:hypothetical protein
MREFEKKTAIDRPASGRSSLRGSRRKGVNLMIQTTIVFSADIRKPAERIDGGGNQLIQGRNDLLPHSVPQVMCLEVAGVLTKRQSCLAKIVQDLLPFRFI